MKGLERGAVRFLEESDEIELVSLYGDEEDLSGWEGAPKLPANAGRMQGFGVFGRIKLEAEDRRAVLDSFYDAVSKGTGQAKCWWPRHAIIARRGDKTQTFIFCFECGYGEATGPEQSGMFLIGDDSKAMNALLDRAGITRSKRE